MSTRKGTPRALRMVTAVIGLLILLVVVTFIALVWMAGGLQPPRTLEEAPQTLDGSPRAVGESGGLEDPSPASVAPKPPIPQWTVVSWNIAWGYGWGSEGSGQRRDRSHFKASSESIATFLRDVRADIVLLQEVDFDSTRSAHIDQLRVIGEKSGLPYAARAVSWRANWVPFPYWPPRDHFGRMESGGAVLSRYPIRTNEITLLPKPERHSFVYNLFYLFRYVQRVELDLGGPALTVYNVHLEAFDRATREAEAKQIARELSERATAKSLLFGGDLNSVPPEAKERRGYADEPATDHEHDTTVATLRAAGLVDTMPDASASDPVAAGFTFPSHAPNRKLDYVLVSPDLEVVHARVGVEAGTASDHLPLVVKLRPKTPHPRSDR